MKKLFFSLIIGLFGFINFSIASDVTLELVDSHVSDEYGWPLHVVNNHDLVCGHNIEGTTVNGLFIAMRSDANGGQYRSMADNGSWGGMGICTTGDLYIFADGGFDYGRDFYDFVVSDTYCEDNNLCPEPELTGGVCTGDNWSALFINGIQHAGAPLISVTIPDNVYWDYDSSEEEFILDIGSGYDQDFIDGVIDVQSYRPTSEDFTQTFVGGLILFTPYVVILLFVILVRRLIGRIFKTK